MILNHRYLYNVTDKLQPRPFEDLYHVVSDYGSFVKICRNKADVSALNFDYNQPLHTQESIVEEACRFELGSGNKRLYLFQGYFKIDDYIRQKLKKLEEISIQKSKLLMLRIVTNLYYSVEMIITSCMYLHLLDLQNKEKVYIDSTKTSGGSFVKVKYSSGYYYEEIIP